MIVASKAATYSFWADSCEFSEFICSEWIYACCTDETDFLLSDDKAERDYNFNLQESHKRARERPLFEVSCVTSVYAYVFFAAM
jgi:hypothetical protein